MTPEHTVVSSGEFHPRTRVISLNPDLGGQINLVPLIYALERALSTSARKKGLDYVIFGGSQASPPSGFPARVIRTFVKDSGISYNPERLHEYWRDARDFSDRVLWSLERLRAGEEPRDIHNIFYLYHGHPGHLAALIRLGLALGGTSPIIVNLYHLHFMHGPALALSAGPHLRAFLRATRNLRREANVHLRVDTPRLARVFERETGEAIEVLPFFSPVGDEVGVAPAKKAARTPIRVVYPTAAPALDKGFDLVMGLAERLGREDVEIICREPTIGAFDACLPTAAALRGRLRLLQDFLPESSYLELLRSADIVLVPYRRWRFFSRTSGIVADAIRLGKPLVGTADTWIGDQILEASSGTTFSDGDVDDLVDAVRRAINGLNTAAPDAAKREAWLQRNNLDAFWNHVLNAGTRKARSSQALVAVGLMRLAALTRAGLSLRFRARDLWSAVVRRWRRITTGASGSLALERDEERRPGAAAIFAVLPVIQWRTRGVKAIELRLDRPDGLLISRGGPKGEVSGTFWLNDRRRIFLQDVSDGRALSAENTLDSVHFDYPSDPASPPAVPRPGIAVALPLIGLVRRVVGLGLGRLSVAAPLELQGPVMAAVSWSCEADTAVEVRVGRPDGELFARASGPGSKDTGAWVVDGTSFVLLDARPEVPRFLRLMDVRVVSSRCPRYPPTAAGRSSRVERPLDPRAVPPAGGAIEQPEADSVSAATDGKRSPFSVVGPTQWGIKPPRSSGEPFHLIRHARAILDRFGGDRLVLFVSRSQLSLGRLFPNAPVTLLDREAFDFDVLGTSARVGRVFKLDYGPLNDSGYGHHHDVRAGFAHLLLEELGLSLDGPVIEPTVPPDVRDEVRRTFRKLGLPEGRTILMAPVSYSQRPNSSRTWHRIVAILRQRGFSVVTNCAPGESPLPGSMPWHGDLSETYAAIEMGGILISARSGLVDICSTAQARLHIVERESGFAGFPGVVILTKLAANALVDRAVYHSQALDEDPLTFAERVLAHPDLQ